MRKKHKVPPQRLELPEKMICVIYSGKNTLDSYSRASGESPDKSPYNIYALVLAPPSKRTAHNWIDVGSSPTEGASNKKQREVLLPILDESVIMDSQLNNM